jgi:hypothetical protein
VKPQFPLTVHGAPIDAVAVGVVLPVYFSAAAYFVHKFQKSQVPPPFRNATVGMYW